MSALMKILIAYEGSPSGDAALEDLQRAGLPDQAKALVLCVSELWLPPPSSFAMVETGFAERPPYDVEGTREWAARACHRLHTMFPRWVIDTQMMVGSPAGIILNQAEIWKPDLIVVGSHARSAMGRFFLGSVSQKIVTEAACSVRVGRFHGMHSHQPPRLLVGVDGSPSSRAAVRNIANRHWPKGTEVALITSVGPFSSPEGSDEGFSAFGAVDSEERKHQELNFAHMLQEELKGQLLTGGLIVANDIVEGDPKQVLLRKAEEWSADSIFIGSRGFRGLKRLLLGSVSLAVVNRAKCSVEVVRTDDSE